MGHVFRIWRGDWKNNGHEQWHFVPNHQDYGFTMYMDSAETLEVIDATVRENYMLGCVTPVLITYGMPDWMIFPSGLSPPITIATTADLVSLISRRPPLSEITLLVTFRAKNVVEFQFLCRSDFTIGSSTYVVGDGQDERARARYESLILGERLVASERVMNEIFGEQEMLILHHVALEIGHADRVLPPQPSSGPQPLAQIPAADAPSVLWDVGLDLLDYPEFYNAQRDGGLVTQDSAFWNELIEDNYQYVEGLFLLPNNKVSDLRLTQDQTLVGGGVISQVGNKDVVALHETAGESSTVPTAIISTLLESAIAPREIGGEGKEDAAVHGPSGTTKEKVDSTLPGLSLTLGLGCGSGERDALTRPSANVDNTSSEGSDTEIKIKYNPGDNFLGLNFYLTGSKGYGFHGLKSQFLNDGEMDDYGAQFEVGMMFRNRDSFKQHIAMFAMAKKFCYRSAKSDPSMMILKCISSTCPWRVYATKLMDSEVFEVRKLASVHTCSIAECGGYQGQATSAVRTDESKFFWKRYQA
ncbi:hypothetical protein F2Q69_00048074 [Brassica cretica]|uniref:Transposase MuDR plant domain-containing protein n=1 Tax=Brassica cretica TaxID=69181 RepID=A0A8S9PPP1_BRACR|nr:hypothetical protein F2Q69_00048074 [Brassica cretica]